MPIIICNFSFLYPAESAHPLPFVCLTHTLGSAPALGSLALPIWNTAEHSSYLFFSEVSVHICWILSHPVQAGEGGTEDWEMVILIKILQSNNLVS